jgi:hypothetical protein
LASGTSFMQRRFGGLKSGGWIARGIPSVYIF